MISSQWVELCGYGHGIASGWKSTGRGTKLQISAPLAANVPCQVGGRCTELTRGSQATAQREPQPLLRPHREKAMQKAARHEHVVALCERDVAEQAAQHAAAAMDVDQLVGVAIRDVDRVLHARERDAGDQVVV